MPFVPHSAMQRRRAARFSWPPHHPGHRSAIARPSPRPSPAIAPPSESGRLLARGWQWRCGTGGLALGNSEAPARPLMVELSSGEIKVDGGQLVDVWPVEGGAAACSGRGAPPSAGRTPMYPSTRDEWSELHEEAADLLADLPAHMVDLRPVWQRTISGKGGARRRVDSASIAAELFGSPLQTAPLSPRRRLVQRLAAGQLLANERTLFKRRPMVITVEGAEPPGGAADTDGLADADVGRESGAQRASESLVWRGGGFQRCRLTTSSLARVSSRRSRAARFGCRPIPRHYHHHHRACAFAHAADNSGWLNPRSMTSSDCSNTRRSLGRRRRCRCSPSSMVFTSQWAERNSPREMPAGPAFAPPACLLLPTPPSPLAFIPLPVPPSYPAHPFHLYLCLCPSDRQVALDLCNASRTIERVLTRFEYRYAHSHPIVPCLQAGSTWGLD